MLLDYEPLSLAELGELLVCETGSPSRLVTRLVEAGMVEQKPSATDSRKVSLTLSEKGRELAHQIISIEEEMYASFQPLLQDAPIREMIKLLWHLVDGKPAGKALARRKGKEPHVGDRESKA